jgi:iron-sulfur cluster repair protein YtfE (RIC family)
MTATATTRSAHPASSPEQRAIAAIVSHHAQLRRGLYERVIDLREAVLSAGEWEGQLAALIAYLAGVVLPHAAAEEATVYPALSADPRGELFIDAMLLDHEGLTDQTRALANACDKYAALALAEATAALFALHVTKENDLLLPTLQHADDVKLTELLANLRDRTGHGGGTDVP